jgi:hypothetical protein
MNSGMNPPHHDYSRHSVDELQVEVYNLDVTKFPERARSLQVELLKRLAAADTAAAESSTAKAVAEGAQFDELTKGVAQRFFWPFFGFSFLISFFYGFLVGFVAAFIGGIVTTAQERGGDPVSNPAQLIQIAILLVFAVPFGIFWLKQVTKRSFGGYGLRILKTGGHDVA